MHIQRRFNNENEQKKERIYSIPNINNNINQLFIDNLQDSNIYLKDLLPEQEQKNPKIRTVEELQQ